MPTASPNPFLAGNFAPVRHETDATALPIEGTLPRELRGAFVRNGPDPRHEPLGRYHWFDGDGMLHAVVLDEGRASYRNRYVRTAGFAREAEAGRALWSGLAEPPRFDNPEGPFKNVANTALVFHAGKLLALWEAGFPHHVRLPGLETVGEYSFGGALQHAFSAHPKVDPVTGEMCFFGYGFAPPFVQYGVVDRAGAIVHTAEIDLELPVMMHDFAITERYALFMDLPLTFRVERFTEGGGMPLAFERDRPARFGLLPRRGEGREVRWFETPSCYVLHNANAYEDGDEVVLVGCRMDELDVMNLGAMTDPYARMHRWRFDLRTGRVREEPLDDAGADFARIDDRRAGRANRYAYAARFARRPDAPPFDALLKYDLARGSVQTHEHGPHRYGGEGVFVPREGGRDEDDGWVVTFVHDEREGQSELVVIDARAFAQPPVARVRMPQRVPYGFHGAWVSHAEIAAQTPFATGS